ncbi:hypothetical protein ACFX2K_039176 [Malus domestica]
MVDFHGGNKLACLSLPSFVKCLEELLILLLEDLIPHCYLVVLSFQLIDFSLKKNSFSFLLSLFRTMCKGVSFCVLWLPSLPMLERDARSKESVRMIETSLTQLKRVGISVASHRRRQMLMHKISEDFGTTESVRFCDLRLVASVTSEDKYVNE